MDGSGSFETENFGVGFERHAAPENDENLLSLPLLQDFLQGQQWEFLFDIPKCAEMRRNAKTRNENARMQGIASEDGAARIQAQKGRVTMEDSKRLGIVGVVVSDLAFAEQVNDVIHEHSGIVVARMGIPYKDRNVSVISLLVDGEQDEINALTGELGKIKDVSAKAMLNKIK